MGMKSAHFSVGSLPSTPRASSPPFYLQEENWQVSPSLAVWLTHILPLLSPSLPLQTPSSAAFLSAVAAPSLSFSLLPQSQK